MIQALLNLATRCRVLLADSSSKAQTLQAALLDGEPKDGLEHIEPFGFTACPMPGAEGVALFFGLAKLLRPGLAVKRGADARLLNGGGVVTLHYRREVGGKGR